MPTGRLEAFSDGVMAVAITLLVLNLRVPDLARHQDLARALGDQWQAYSAYAISFITIGIIWINHHAMIARLRESDHAILMLNLVLLLSIGLLPFATGLVAESLRQGNGETLAAALYAGMFLLMSLAFANLNRHILFAKHHLLRTAIDHARRRQILTRGVTGLIPYALAAACAPLSPYLTIAICGAVAGFYSLPVASGGR
ncbi:MAG: DUF1211 domain-containing protein [Acidobacteriota bacterium]|nr:DUF1211 domain-containing protein [Acidobacteriota bacterium]